MKNILDILNNARTLLLGLLKDMEHYKSLQGELVALNLIESEISQHFKDSNA